MLKLGMMCVVGDGCSINVSREPWVFYNVIHVVIRRVSELSRFASYSCSTKRSKLTRA